MIELREVTKAYGGTVVLDRVDLDVDSGEIVAVVGRSGTGKTSLLNLVGGLDSRYEGRVTVAGTVLADLDDAGLADYRSSRVGFVFQTFHLLDHLSCLENVSLAAVFARDRWAAADIRARAMEVLGEVGLGERAGSRPTALSGGERQRVAVARALFHRPALLLCDELTGNLDEDNAAMLVETLCRSRRLRGTTVVVATHDPLVCAAADRVLRLVQGGLEEQRGAA